MKLCSLFSIVSFVELDKIKLACLKSLFHLHYVQLYKFYPHEFRTELTRYIPCHELLSDIIRYTISHIVAIHSILPDDLLCGKVQGFFILVKLGCGLKLQ